MNETGRLPTLPHSCPCSTIGAEELNYRVREGNGWVLLAMITQKGRSAFSDQRPVRDDPNPRLTADCRRSDLIEY